VDKKNNPLPAAGNRRYARDFRVKKAFSQKNGTLFHFKKAAETGPAKYYGRVNFFYLSNFSLFCYKIFAGAARRPSRAGSSTDGSINRRIIFSLIMLSSDFDEN
jgi:hypothetical protein